MTREDYFTVQRTLPIRWVDLMSFDREWLLDKTTESYQDVDGVFKTRVFDRSGKQVYPVID